MGKPANEGAARVALRILGMLLRLPECDESAAPSPLKEEPPAELSEHGEFLKAIDESRDVLLKALIELRLDQGRSTGIELSARFNVRPWLYRKGHAYGVASLKRLLEEIAEVAPQSLQGEEADPPCYWIRAEDGSVEVRQGQFLRRLTAPRLIQIFLIVAGMGERGATWDDVLGELIRRDMEAKAERVQDGEPIQLIANAQTLRRYGTRIRKELGPMGLNWEQSTQGAQWKGGDPLDHA